MVVAEGTTACVHVLAETGLAGSSDQLLGVSPRDIISKQLPDWRKAEVRAGRTALLSIACYTRMHVLGTGVLAHGAAMFFRTERCVFNARCATLPPCHPATLKAYHKDLLPEVEAAVRSTLASLRQDLQQLLPEGLEQQLPSWPGRENLLLLVDQVRESSREAEQEMRGRLRWGWGVAGAWLYDWGRAQTLLCACWCSYWTLHAHVRVRVQLINSNQPAMNCPCIWYRRLLDSPTS
jgi:hypothetical protein